MRIMMRTPASVLETKKPPEDDIVTVALNRLPD